MYDHPFCYFDSSGARNGGDLAVGAMQQRAVSDQLPSTVSVLQHTSDIDCPLRFCAIDVDQGATGERVHQRVTPPVPRDRDATCVSGSVSARVRG